MRLAPSPLEKRIALCEPGSIEDIIARYVVKPLPRRRPCAHEGCQTPLSQLNPGNKCFRHQQGVDKKRRIVFDESNPDEQIEMTCSRDGCKRRISIGSTSGRCYMHPLPVGQTEIKIMALKMAKG